MAGEQDTAALEQRIADLERRLAREDQAGGGGRSGIETAFWALMHNLFPQEARKHLRAAGREQLLAARVYLDTWIERMETEEREPKRRHEKIELD
jgi:hypothetical protein